MAIGVRKAAAAATVSDIITGRTEMPRSPAALIAIGIMMSAVAVFEISWPKTAVITKSPSKRAYGPASPTTSTRISAMSSAAPDCWTATDTGIIPATSTTVVHEIDRYASFIESTRVRTRAPAASTAATAAETTPVASRATIPARITRARRDPRPMGTA